MKLARHDVGLRARRSRSPRSRSRARPATSADAARVDLQDARRRRARSRRRARGSARGAPRARALAFVGWNPAARVHFAGGGHNDAWMAALVIGALALGAAGKRQWARRLAGSRASSIKWIPLVLLPAPRARGARDRPPVGHLGVRARRRRAGRARDVAVRLRVARRARPARANANDETQLRACPHRLEQLGVPDVARARPLRASAFALAYVWLAARGVARTRAARRSPPGCCSLARRTSRPGTSSGSSRSRRPRRTALARGLALVLCAYLLRRRSRSALKTRTPSSLEHEPPLAGCVAARDELRVRVGTGREPVRDSPGASRRPRPTCASCEEREAEDRGAARRGARRA